MVLQDSYSMDPTLCVQQLFKFSIYEEKHFNGYEIPTGVRAHLCAQRYIEINTRTVNK